MSEITGTTTISSIMAEVKRTAVLEAAVRTIIKDMQEYLEPKGEMKDQDLINRVIGAVDNPEVFRALERGADNPDAPLSPTEAYVPPAKL